MSPRGIFVLYFILPVFARGGRGGHGSSGGGGSHYPHSNTGLSGNSGYKTSYNTYSGGHQSASYPHSNTGLSGNNNNHQHTSHTTNVHRNEVHNHYHYSPPQQINYGSGYHPVYHGSPPVYVYQYRDSGSRFDTLLTGLALYNLGKMSSHHHDHYGDRTYTGTSGEICKLGIKKANGDYEEARVDCRLMSSFIYEAESQPKISTKTTVTNTTTVSNNNTTTVVQSTKVVDALESKGPSIQVSDGMSCYMIRISRDFSMNKHVDCGLLQTYARRSFNTAPRNSQWGCAVLLSLTYLFLIR